MTAGRNATILQVAVPCPIPGTFDYRAPADFTGTVAPGQRVQVPFGRRQVVGVLVGCSDTSALPENKLRRATAILDEAPLLSADVLELARWAADYYHHPIGEVFATLLPTALRQGKPARRRPPEAWRLTEAGRAISIASLGRRAPRQAALLEQAADAAAEGVTAETLRDTGGDWRTALNALVEKGLLEACPPPRTRPTPERPSLNEEQQAACDALMDMVESHGVALLDGVTGSGKTEVYLRVIADVLQRDRQVLVLVPEIGLTPQLVRRFRQRLPGRLVSLHSGLSDGERLDAWLAAATGEADVIVGTRSALFTPLARPGLLVIDEEHDLSFKQQDGFRYHARDLAVVRARRLGVPVVLGSATPAMESLHNAERGRYQHLRLTRRAGVAQPPTVHLLDLRGQRLTAGLSEPLIARMRKNLEEGGQSLLFLNRRGYAPVLLCHDCGWVAECPRCDARLTWHQAANRLRCHHCGHETMVHRQCGDCGSIDLRPIGQGTEQLEQTLESLFPDVPIARIDRDSTRRKGAMEHLLARARSGEARILLGTQMLAKGHHLPDVSLVGLLDCDQGLFGTDFHGSERMAQLITQVSGRAGRAQRPGEVLLQTHHPEHPLLQLLLRDGYPAFARACMEERAAALLPPFSHLALLRAEAVQPEAPRQFLQAARELAASVAAREVSIMGPVPAPMERRAGRYRAQLLLQCRTRKPLHITLSRLGEALQTLSAARRVRWSLDVDPQEMI